MTEQDTAREQRTVQSQLPLFQQCSIQVKIGKFHANMAALDIPVPAQRDFLASLKLN